MGFCNFYTPVEGQRQNSIKLTLPNLCNQLVQYSRKANGEVLCIYGDHGYQLRPQRQGPFSKFNTKTRDFNKLMNLVRTSVK